MPDQFLVVFCSALKYLMAAGGRGRNFQVTQLVEPSQWKCGKKLQRDRHTSVQIMISVIVYVCVSVSVLMCVRV